MTTEVHPIDGQEFVRELGVGLAFATFVARDAHGALTVCKRMRLAAVGDAAKAQMQRESDALRAIGGRGAPRLIATGVDAFGPWLSMELLSGEPMSRGFDAPILDVARAAFTALALVHDSGVVHGDVSPSNVLIGEAAWLVDFCTAQGWGLPPLDTHEFTGTISFAAPEHARGEPIDARADLFGLAASIVSAATALDPRPHGERPIGAQLAMAGERPLDPAFVALAPGPLVACLAFDAAARPKSARAVLSEL